MAIRRKVRMRGKEPATRIHPLQTEKVQRNMERLNQIVHAASARATDGGMASAPIPAIVPAKPVPRAVYAPSEFTQPTVSSASSEAAGTAPDPIYVPDPEKIMNKADEDLRAAMQQAQEAIKSAESLLLKSEENTEDSVLEAQRIAERAVAAAISQTDALLRPSMQAAAPQPPQLAPDDSSANSEVL